MKIDLYTLYLYSYAKEFLFSKNPEMKKLWEFTYASKSIFIDEFIHFQIVADNPIDFFIYLKNRECFKINISKNEEYGAIIECSCRYSIEYWIRDEFPFEEDVITFKKLTEVLWATKYRDLSEKEIIEERRLLKLNNYYMF